MVPKIWQYAGRSDEQVCLDVGKTLAFERSRRITPARKATTTMADLAVAD
jgi:hypothetical protein